MQADNVNLFIMNAHSHYFEVKQEVPVGKELLRNCRLFDNEPALLEAVCQETGCELDEVAGSTFYITMRHGEPTLIDDRGFAQTIEGPVEDFIADFEL
ncbi:hypothetical protein LCGC14_0170320 [marine sediment metagenome]|jgi:hypothetical protein|uniref:Uncharacterized protein n=1 Tax=marine sediment metagenome TaxID=412755 RepID=A0A0F9XUS6_9ZZZZ